MSARAWKRRRAKWPWRWPKPNPHRMVNHDATAQQMARYALAERGARRRAWVAKWWLAWRTSPECKRLTVTALKAWRYGGRLYNPGRQPRCRSVGVLEDRIHLGTGVYRAAKATRHPGRPEGGA